MSTRALLLLNPKARSGAATPHAALDRLRQAGFELIEPPADSPRNLAQIVREHVGRIDAVIAGGGDGTLTGAVDGIVEAGLPLGVLPLGTANDLARTLGLPTDPLAAADVIVAGNLRKIDLGWVNGTHFFNVASIGLGTSITRRLSGASKSRWGVLAYLFAAASVVIRSRPFRAEIKTESETINVKTVQIAVGNGRYYGGGMTVHAAADIDDGLLHFLSLEVEHWWQIIPLLPGLRNGTLEGSTRARVLTGQSFEVRPHKKRKSISADGEISGRAPATFKVVPRALDVYAPAPPK